MELIRLNKENIDSEHICCSIAEKKGETGVSDKKAWLLKGMENGLEFVKADVRGKVFIEYSPLKNAFVPVIGDEYLYIHCFWVSGQYKGKGYGKELLNTCINDAKEKGYKGVVALSSHKKKPFLSDPKYFKKHGFKCIDTWDPYYELLAYLFDPKEEELPKFNNNSSKDTIGDKVLKRGFTFIYTHQCPHTEKYIKLVTSELDKIEMPYKVHQIISVEDAKAAPNPFTTYSVYYNGAFITNEILTVKKIHQIINEYK